MKLVQNALWLALSALVAACGGADHSVTQPPRPKLKPAIASVVLTTDTAFLFVTKPAALADLVTHVYDATGAEVAKSDVTFSADVPFGWSVRNDSIFPPSTEDRHALRVRAAYKVATLSGDLIPAGLAPSFSTVAADSTPQVVGDAIVDLRLHHFRALDFKCTALPGRVSVVYWDSSVTSGSGTSDSIVVRHRVDSIYYTNAIVDSIGTSASAIWTSFGVRPPYTALYLRAAYTQYFDDGSTRSATGASFVPFITGQAPDSVQLSGPLLVRTSVLGQPLTYTAVTRAGEQPNVSLCISNWPYGGPLTLQEQ